jgi:micrococcal nuclease
MNLRVMMEHRILLIGIIILVIAFSGCIGSSEEIKNKSSQISINESNSSNSSTLENVNKKNYKYETSGYCSHVVDGDTIDVDGVGRIRFVGINTPERGEIGYQEAKDFVKNSCLGKTVGLDIDNDKHYDKYGRILAVVYADDVNLNAELLKRGYAEVLYIPPSEFNPYSWKN